MNNLLKISLIISIIFLSLFIFRFISPAELDDLSPGIPCDEKLIAKSDILWVIPNFENVSIDKQWCEKISSFNKTIGMHGITHSYREFYDSELTQQELEEGIQIFQDCFGFKPKIFKAPQWLINSENKRLLKESKIKNHPIIYRLIRKNYHCNQGGVIPSFMDKIF